MTRVNFGDYFNNIFSDSSYDEVLQSIEYMPCETEADRLKLISSVMHRMYEVFPNSSDNIMDRLRFAKLCFGLFDGLTPSLNVLDDLEELRDTVKDCCDHLRSYTNSNQNISEAVRLLNEISDVLEKSTVSNMPISLIPTLTGYHRPFFCCQIR